jgi:hypothetical protein
MSFQVTVTSSSCIELAPANFPTWPEVIAFALDAGKDDADATLRVVFGGVTWSGYARDVPKQWVEDRRAPEKAAKEEAYDRSLREQAQPLAVALGFGEAAKQAMTAWGGAHLEGAVWLLLALYRSRKAAFTSQADAEESLEELLVVGPDAM